MPFQVSPGINVSEVDLTAGAQQVSVSDAGFVGAFQWGPAFDVKSISSEDELVRTFGKPDDTNYEHWFSAYAFLAYSNLLRVVRALPSVALNATASAKTLPGNVSANGANNIWVGAGGFATNNAIYAGQRILIGTSVYTVSTVTNSISFTTTANSANTVTANTIGAYGVLIKNGTHYEATYPSGTLGYGAWAAKYAGDLGSALKVSVCTSAAAFSAGTLTGALALTTGSNTVTGTGTSFVTELIVGDSLTVNGAVIGVVSAIANATSLSLASGSTVTASPASGQWGRKWEYASLFDRAPGTSAYVSQRGGSSDELHVVVVDRTGDFTGVPGTVLERYSFLSKASNAKDPNGEKNYYVTVLNRDSKYIWWLAAPTSLTTNWGGDAASAFGASALPETSSFAGGLANNSTLADADLQAGWDLYKNPDAVSISLAICGPASATLASYVIQNVCEVRKDSVAFVSPSKANVVNNVGSEVAGITTFRNSLPSSSYAFCDSGWKYLYDKFNDKYRWVPLNGDIAGIAARSDTQTDPWFSPAGFTRGNIKNAVKLAWNPTQLQRDDLYKIGVNSVVSFPGQGVVLYGDKTLLDRPSAFDRINVRRLFIILEKTIARLARTQLFEFNDEFTRSQFRNIVEPYLRDVKARRGVLDYRVICDESNNPPEVVEQNSFVGDIYIKPSRSINFIQLNFVAVRNGVSFQEVTGAL